MKIVTIERDWATVMDDGNVFLPMFQHSIPRDEFLSAIGLTLPANVKQVSYEPHNNIYHILTTGGLIAFESSVGNEIIEFIHANFDVITLMMVDRYNADNKPSQYHTYENHRWVISAADQQLLDADNARKVAKQQRAAQVAAITVTTQAGNTFDGDEISQGRMARAIIALQATGTPSVTWVLADNSVIDATAAELTEALALAGAAQAAIWVIA